MHGEGFGDWIMNRFLTPVTLISWGLWVVLRQSWCWLWAWNRRDHRSSAQHPRLFDRLHVLVCCRLGPWHGLTLAELRSWIHLPFNLRAIEKILNTFLNDFDIHFSISNYIYTIWLFLLDFLPLPCVRTLGLPWLSSFTSHFGLLLLDVRSASTPPNVRVVCFCNLLQTKAKR